MDGQLVAVSLMNLKGRELRMLYALLFKTNILSLLRVKTKDLFNKDVDHFNANLEKEMQKIEQISDEVLQLDLFLKLTEVYEMKGLPYHSIPNIEQQCQAIVGHTYSDLLKNDKEFILFTDSATDQTQLQQIIQFEMQKLFFSFDDKYKELKDEERYKFTQKIKEFLVQLPDDEQIRLKNRLQIEEVTKESIHGAMINLGAVFVLSAIVEIAGFSAYTTLTTAMASTIALSGVAMPVGVYTLASSLLTLVINPFILIPLAIGGGGWLVSRQNKVSQKRLIPIVLLQMSLPSMVALPNYKEELFQPFISRWQHLKNKHTSLLDEQHHFLKEIALRQKNATIEEQKSTELSNKIQTLTKEKESIRQALVNVIYSIEKKDQTITYENLLQIVSSKKERIATLEIQKANNSTQKGFWKSISTAFDNSTLRSEIRTLTEEIRQTEIQLVEELLQTEGSILMNERQRYIEIVEKTNELIQLRAEALKTTLNLREQIAKLEEGLSVVKRDLKEHQTRYYGIAED
jgi:hypothetical protein